MSIKRFCSHASNELRTYQQARSEIEQPEVKISNIGYLPGAMISSFFFFFFFFFTPFSMLLKRLFLFPSHARTLSPLTGLASGMLKKMITNTSEPAGCSQSSK
jgi:hypothetical protein